VIDVKQNRPVNLDFGTIKLPITSYVSILHRASGVILFAAVALFLLALDASLASPDSFAALAATLASPVWQFVIWASLSALGYHLVLGLRHLVMDFGVGETLEGGLASAKVAAVVAVVVIAAIAGWVFAW
jgi:succinate dehydrogenase / fumarate reductase cytochrome b subunit